MNAELSQQLQAAQADLEPEFKNLRAVMAALTTAARLAADEKPEALAMQKARLKLEQVAPLVENERLDTAVATFAAETKRALDALAFEFARDLKETFEARGQQVEGRPPTLVVGDLVLNIDIANRKAQWFYGKEPLTRPIPLSISGIVKAYDQQQKEIVNRTIDTEAFLAELYNTWQGMLDKRLEQGKRRPTGGRLNIIELFSQLTLNRQPARFWNAPARSTFKDYPRAHFVRDLTLLQQANTSLHVDGHTHRLRLGVATKSQADQSNRSLWLPEGPLEGQYYADITFDP
jgi:hypothetical protein